LSFGHRRHPVRVRISGSTIVRDDTGEVTDAALLRRLDGVVYDRETFTDHFGNRNVAGYEKYLRPDNEAKIREKMRQAEFENATRNALLPSGHLRLVYNETHNQVWVATEYQATRELSDPELALLVQHTLGQWSDGIGENFLSLSKELCGFIVDCSRVREPVVEQMA
jgi:hypothetical protein